jgi:hypothetical protein
VGESEKARQLARELGVCFCKSGRYGMAQHNHENKNNIKSAFTPERKVNVYSVKGVERDH